MRAAFLELDSIQKIQYYRRRWLSIYYAEDTWNRLDLVILALFWIIAWLRVSTMLLACWFRLRKVLLQIR